MPSGKLFRWLEKRRKTRAEYVARGEFPPGEFEAAMENIRAASYRPPNPNYKGPKNA